MDLQLQGRRALITGGGSGIGRATAAALAREGCRVTIVGRSSEKLQRAAVELSQEGGEAVTWVALDTSHDTSVRSGAAEAVEKLGGVVDILVNGAAPLAGGGPRGLQEVDDQAFRAEMDVKVLGYLRMARAVAPGMTAQGWGRIINISGLNARNSGSITGSIRNVAVSALTKNLADELGPHGVNVTVVHPGATRTDSTQALIAARAKTTGTPEIEVEAQLANSIVIGRLVSPAEVADVIAFLASPRSVAITGDAVAAGGGWKGAIYY